jgi:hypothetical protein
MVGTAGLFPAVPVMAVVEAKKGLEKVLFRAVCPSLAVDKEVLPFPGREDERISSGHHLLLDPQFVIPEDDTMVSGEIDA